MSDQNPLVRTARDDLRLGRLLLVGGVSILIGALAVGWADLMLERTEARAGQTPWAGTAGAELPREIGIVDQTLVDVDRWGLRLFEAQRRELEGYGWADRQENLVQIPIDRAIDLMAAPEKGP